MALALAFAALTVESEAQCELQTIAPPELPPTSGTGWRLAQDGETFAVASPGVVHVYRQDGLTAFEVAALAWPGYVPSYTAISALALDGATLAVGFSGLSNESSVRIYEQRGGAWLETAHLQPQRNDEFRFGRELALEGDRLLVASNVYHWPLPNIGLVFVYERVAGVWTRVDQLTKSGARSDNFGTTLDLDGERVVAGGSRGPGYPLEVNAFEHTASGWVRQELVFAPEMPMGASSELDLHDDLLMIGASSPNAGGMVRVFEHDGASWSETGELGATDGLHNGATGVAIVDADLVLVGAASNDERRANGGVVYAFERIAGTWQQTWKRFPSSGSFEQGFGRKITCDGDLAVVGSGHGPVRTFSPRETQCRTLIAFPAVVSLTQGGQQTLWLNPPRELAGKLYCLLGSATGFEPGFRFRGAHIPLVPDPYLARSFLGRPPFENHVGELALQKPRGTVTIDVPPLTDIGLAGLTLYHAFLVLDGETVRHVSNVKTLTLVP